MRGRVIIGESEGLDTVLGGEDIKKVDTKKEEFESEERQASCVFLVSFSPNARCVCL